MERTSHRRGDPVLSITNQRPVLEAMLCHEETN